MGLVGRNGHPVSEPTPVQDTFADGVVDIEVMDSFVRYVFSVRRRMIEAEGFENVIVAKIVLPFTTALELNGEARKVLDMGRARMLQVHG